MTSPLVKSNLTSSKGEPLLEQTTYLSPGFSHIADSECYYDIPYILNHNDNIISKDAYSVAFDWFLKQGELTVEYMPFDMDGKRMFRYRRVEVYNFTPEIPYYMNKPHPELKPRCIFEEVNNAIQSVEKSILDFISKFTVGVDQKWWDNLRNQLNSCS